MGETTFVEMTRSAQLFCCKGPYMSNCTHVHWQACLHGHGGPCSVLGIEKENSSGDENKRI